MMGCWSLWVTAAAWPGRLVPAWLRLPLPSSCVYAFLASDRRTNIGALIIRIGFWGYTVL